jgi:hypothetical protein
VVIDGGANGNDARYINHSCDPNCESLIEDRRVFIEAIRTIQPGEELTYDYQIGRDKEDPSNVDEIYACRCGAGSCRGSMLWPPKRKSRRKAKVKAHQVSRAAVIGAMGVVYGDIGTSPLYALEASLNGAGAPLDRLAVLGVLSLIFWSLLVVVTLKYVVLIMRADNEGEGGILSLFALVQRTLNGRQPLAARHRDAGGAGRGAVLLRRADHAGDLGAERGGGAGEPQSRHRQRGGSRHADHHGRLFAIQYRGTERVGRLFGPIMLVWFLVLAVTGTARC